MDVGFHDKGCRDPHVYMRHLPEGRHQEEDRSSTIGHYRCNSTMGGRNHGFSKWADAIDAREVDRMRGGI